MSRSLVTATVPCHGPLLRPLVTVPFHRDGPVSRSLVTVPCHDPSLVPSWWQWRGRGPQTPPRQGAPSLPREVGLLHPSPQQRRFRVVLVQIALFTSNDAPPPFRVTLPPACGTRSRNSLRLPRTPLCRRLSPLPSSESRPNPSPCRQRTVTAARASRISSPRQRRHWFVP